MLEGWGSLLHVRIPYQIHAEVFEADSSSGPCLPHPHSPEPTPPSHIHVVPGHKKNCAHVVTVSQPNPEALRETIRETRRLTDKPFGVNITFLPAINPPDYGAFVRAA